MQALAALAHAHSLGVVHRDLKPANLMLTESGAVKVMDFGIARVVGTEHLTSAGFMMGTPAYMAPEQVLGEDIDARADLYAMGVVLYHLLTGQLPFKGDTPFEMAQSRLRDQPTPVRSVRAELPPWLETVLGMAIHRDPPRRFQSAPTFREALGRGLANLPLETPESSAVPPELVATAAPSSIAVAAVSTASASSGAAPVRAEIPKVPPPVDPVTLKTPTTAPPPAATPSRTPVRLGLAAGIVILAALLAWVTMRPSRQAPSVTSDASTPAPAPPAPTPADPPPPANETPAPASGGARPAAGAPVTPAASTGTAPPSSTVPGATSGATDPAAASAGRAGGAPVTTPRGANAAAGRGRGRGGALDTPLDFQDVRLLVVVGTKAEEQPGVLNFGAGRVAVIGGQSGATLVAIPYTDLSYAYYTKAKDPKWSPVLAAPPGNVNLPGRLFSPARHWLTLQSQSSFLIARLSDSSWRQVLQTVTARTGLEVEHPGTLQ